ncbi:MAG: iron-only hydrogenase system regulator [Alphaproteobacteria bacterium]|nr:iron-only hydrogenase system regulator [Alphaproteobacteria bacterium]
METRVAVIAVIIKNRDTVSQLNEILHTYADYIIGRMGLPYLPKKVSIMSVAVDAPQDVISALSGKIGALSGISVKTAYADA